MEQNKINGDAQSPENQKLNLRQISIALAVLIIFSALVYRYQGPARENTPRQSSQSGTYQNATDSIENKTLPVVMGDVGRKLVESGVIDEEKFAKLYPHGLGQQEKDILAGNGKEKLVINSENAGVLLNILWAVGLSNKNEILEQGSMSDTRYGGAGNFASTGGWIISRGNPMDHYSAHEFIRLTPEQQALVERISKNIYRPCCGNSTYFPDCNHGMAMLGLLQLMASQGVGEAEMYRTALAVNSFWFPDTYETIALYLEQNGMSMDSADPKEILGYNYSSIQGFEDIRRKVTVPPQQQNGGGSCSV